MALRPQPLTFWSQTGPTVTYDWVVFNGPWFDTIALRSEKNTYFFVFFCITLRKSNHLNENFRQNSIQLYACDKSVSSVTNRTWFYPTMLCVARTVLSKDVCPAKLIFKIFSPSPHSHTNLLFFVPNVVAIFRRDSHGASRAGVWKKSRFSTTRFISEMIKIGPLLLWNANRKPYASFRMVPFQCLERSWLT